MTSGPNETVLGDIQSLLQLKRPLLPINKYAAREGVSTEIVEEYGRLGVVQIRKYKGRTYVVDVPLSPYLPVPEGFQILQGSHETASPAAERRDQAVDKTSQAKEISELVPPSASRQAQKTIRDTDKIAAKAIKPNIETIKAESMSGLGKGLFCKASKITDGASHAVYKLIGKNGASHAAHKREFGHRESASTSAPTPQTGRRQFDIDTEQAGTQRIRQVAVVSLILCLFGVFIVCLWLYMNQKVHHGRLDQAYASIKNVYDDFVQTSQQLSTLQSKLVESTAELEWVKNEVNISKEEAAGMKKELTQLRIGLETIEQNNTAALEQLKEQFQQLTARLGKFIKNGQTSSDSGATGK
jgi:hypothetical protein